MKSSNAKKSKYRIQLIDSLYDYEEDYISFKKDLELVTEPFGIQITMDSAKPASEEVKEEGKVEQKEEESEKEVDIKT